MPTTIAGATLDHVAVAVERWPDAWPRYAVELGGEWSSGGLNVGFGPAQLRYGNGARVEVLQPWQPDGNPFLRRFLDRHGPGPHHMTFKVPDLAAALGHAEEAGFSPLNVDLSDPDWKEAFLHPRQATGIVVQLAQAAHAWESEAPEGFPTGRRPPATLTRATHAVADLAVGLALFEGLLDGRILARETSPDGTWAFADLAWPTPPVLRLVAPINDGAGAISEAQPEGPLEKWLGPLPGRLHHLAFSLPGPVSAAGDASGAEPGGANTQGVAGVLPTDGPCRVIEPEDNLGTRLVLFGAAGGGTPSRG